MDRWGATCVVLDAAEVGAAYVAAREDVRFPRWAQAEGLRRAIHGLQAQGLAVVVVAAETGAGGDFLAHAKLEANVDLARLDHVTISASEDGPGEMLKLAQERGLLFASRVNHRGVAVVGSEVDPEAAARAQRPGALALKELQAWAHEVRTTRQVRYDFDDGGVFRAWIPQGLERVLGRQRGDGLPTVPFAVGRTSVPSTGRGATFAKDQSEDFSRRLGLARSFREPRPLQVAADPVALTRMLEAHHRAPEGLMRVLEGTPRRVATAPPASTRSQRRPPLPVSTLRPVTVERSGMSMTLPFDLGTTI